MEVFDFLVSKGVVFRDAAPGNLPAEGNLTPRRTGMMPSFNDIKDNINNTAGSGIIRPLERAARAAGVDILLQHRMVIVREHPTLGPRARNRCQGSRARPCREHRRETRRET
jgi:hypothetical protein